MAQILDFPGNDLVMAGRLLREERIAEGLTLTQAAAALGKSPITLESWEQGRKPQIAAREAREAYRKYRADTNFSHNMGKNLLFGAFPIRVARDVLELSVDELARVMGYSKSSWTKVEANARWLPDDKIRQLEELVSERWDAVCGAGDLIADRSLANRSRHL